MNFSALILAGGQSSRMGRDKSRLEVAGQPLLARQIALARSVGAREVFVSARTESDYSSFGCPVLLDTLANAGPLAGVERGLATARTPFLLVLAVDLPRLHAGFLHRLAAACTDATGVVPEIRGRLEPLAALYPTRAHPLAEHALQAGLFAVRDFVSACRSQGLVNLHPVASADESCLLNWNSPGDLDDRSGTIQV